MQTQKIKNLLNDSSNDESKFATKKWYVIDSQTTKGKYKQGDTIKFENETVKSSFCNYSNAFILVAVDIAVNGNNDTDVGVKNCAPFSTRTTKINDIFFDEANHIYITMPMYNLTEYSDNYSDTSGSLWQFKRDEVPADNAELTINNSQSFKYKAAVLGKTANAVGGTNSSVKDAKIVVPLKYLSKFWRSLQMPLINCKVYLELNWIENCILSTAGGSAKFEITDAKLHVRIVTLSTKDCANLTKQLKEGFKRSDYSDSYETKPAKVIEKGKNLYKLLNASFQGVNRFFVLAYFIADGGNDTAGIKHNKKYFLPRGEIKNYNVLIDGTNFYDQPINEIIKQYDEVRKVSKRYGDDYLLNIYWILTGCLLDYANFKDHCKLIAVDLSKQKALDADLRAIQQIVFQGVVGGANNTKIRLYAILEQSKK